MCEKIGGKCMYLLFVYFSGKKQLENSLEISIYLWGIWKNEVRDGIEKSLIPFCIVLIFEPLAF